MIFDWIKHGKRMLATKKLAAGDKWERKMAWTQEINFVRYLVYEVCGNDKPTVYGLWSAVKGGTAERLSYDPDAARLAFDGQWRKAKSLGPLFPLPKIRINDAEIGYVDRLNAPIEVKRYWLRLLAFLKTKRAMGDRTTVDKTVESYLMADSGIKGRPCDAFAVVAHWSMQCGLPFRLSVSSGTARYSMPEWAGKGNPFVECTLDEISCVDGLLDPKPYTCVRCGARFAASNKRKTDLCGACHERKKLEDAKRRNNKFRKKSDKI